MSSSDPPQLRLSLPQTASTFKRSFEQFGFDLETTVDSTVVASSSSTDEHRPGPSNGDRNKRARSSSVTPSPAEQARSMDSSPSSSSSHAISSGSSNHAVANHRDAPPATAPTRHPQALENNSAFSSSVAGELSHTSSSGLFDARPREASPVEPPTSSVWSNPPSSTNSSIEHNEQFRLSMERFHAFDSQISSIRSRPSPLPFHIPPSPPTLPPLTLSSPVEHSHSHPHSSAAVSLPSVESLSYTSTSTTAQTSASVPPPTAPPSTTTPSDQYHSGVSSVGFEEFGEFREMTGFFPEQHPNSPSVDRPAARPRHQTPSLLDEPERPQIDRPFRRPPSRQIADNISRNSTLHSWPSNRRGATLSDSDDEFGGRPVVPNLQGRGSLDLPRSRLDSSLLANRIRRSMQSQTVHPASGRMSPPRFPALTPSQIEPNPTQVGDNSRAQEPERFNRHEPWSSHPPSRRPVLAEAFRTLARLGRGRQRTNYTTDSGAERSRSPVGGVSPSPYLCCTTSMGSLIEPKSCHFRRLNISCLR
ncbi:hypothetical protein BJV78DRAFT_929970 [Lactifluus subvellereus]|nr:hypothetical protein BJV78DRAFT_929970 [Lactifluus subvellereus]